MTGDLAGARAKLDASSGSSTIYRLGWLGEQGLGDPGRLPHTVKVLLESLLRRTRTSGATEGDVVALARWPEGPHGNVSFIPGRVLMQDFTGVPAVVDLAAMRSAVARSGGDPRRVNPQVPADLVIDHSVQVDRFGDRAAYAMNLDWEYRRNSERYQLLRWARQAFQGLRVVPPGMGICHQRVGEGQAVPCLDHLRQVFQTRDGLAFPDTLVGT